MSCCERHAGKPSSLIPPAPTPTSRCERRTGKPGPSGLNATFNRQGTLPGASALKSVSDKITTSTKGQNTVSRGTSGSPGAKAGADSTSSSDNRRHQESLELAVEVTDLTNRPLPTGGGRFTSKYCCVFTSGQVVTRPLWPRVLVGHQACLGHGGGQHTTACRICDHTVYGPPLNTNCTTLGGPAPACTPPGEAPKPRVAAISYRSARHARRRHDRRRAAPAGPRCGGTSANTAASRRAAGRRTPDERLRDGEMDC
jgi:hypothetical protein